MPKENQSDGRAHDCDHEQIFCAHGHIHEHRKSRVIGVLMAMCTSKPIIGKCAPPLNGTNFQTFFYPTFFSFAIDSYIDETDFTLGLSQKYH